MPASLLRVQSLPQSSRIWLKARNASHTCQSVSVMVWPESYLAYAACIDFSSPDHGEVVSPLWYSGVTHSPTAGGWPLEPSTSWPSVSVTRLNVAVTQRGWYPCALACFSSWANSSTFTHAKTVSAPADFNARMALV